MRRAACRPCGEHHRACWASMRLRASSKHPHAPRGRGAEGGADAGCVATWSLIVDGCRRRGQWGRWAVGSVAGLEARRAVACLVSGGNGPRGSKTQAAAAAAKKTESPVNLIAGPLEERVQSLGGLCAVHHGRHNPQDEYTRRTRRAKRTTQNPQHNRHRPISAPVSGTNPRDRVRFRLRKSRNRRCLRQDEVFGSRTYQAPREALPER